MNRFLEQWAARFIPKKQGRQNLEALLDGWVGKIGSVALLLVTLIADEGTGAGTSRATDEGTFNRASGLMADDCTRTRTEQASGGCATLRVWSGGSRAVREGKSECGTGERQDDGFHDCLRLLYGYSTFSVIQGILADVYAPQLE